MLMLSISSINVNLFGFSRDMTTPSSSLQTPPKLSGTASNSSMSVWQGFDGINNTGVLSIECRADHKQCDPPDPQVATGPNYVMEMVNLATAIFTKQGVMVRFISLRSFFNVTNGDHLSDPKVLYDLQSGRWFASLLDTDGPFIYLAVSSSSDPTGTWK